MIRRDAERGDNDKEQADAERGHSERGGDVEPAAPKTPDAKSVEES